MARNADYELTCRAAGTYRFARRAEWKSIPKAERPTWIDFNGKMRAYSIGSARRPGRINVAPKPSKYMPHIGAKQRAKGAAA